MKRIFLLTVMCCILLCGCREVTIFGEVTQVYPDGFIITQDGGEPFKVITGENTQMFSWYDQIGASDLKAGTADGIMVTVTGRMERDTMEASEVMIEGQRMRNYCTLDDGTQVHLFKASLYQSYFLEDGTELLFVQRPVDPEEVYINGIGDLRALPEAAQEKIKSYYRAQGVVYDELQTLQEAYDAHLSNGPEFRTYALAQEIVPTAYSDRVIYFQTYATLPHTELRLSAAFDRETGETIPMEDVFICEPGEIAAQLAEIAKINDAVLSEKMKAAFRPEYVTVSQNYLEVNFPAGSLPGEETAFGMGFEYDDAICELLHDWAIPNGGTE